MKSKADANYDLRIAIAAGDSVRSLRFQVTPTSANTVLGCVGRDWEMAASDDGELSWPALVTEEQKQVRMLTLGAKSVHAVN